MLMAMSKDIRVILVKLADRLHNMRTLKNLRPDKQNVFQVRLWRFMRRLHTAWVLEALNGNLKISFRYLNETEFYRIRGLMNEKRAARENLVEEVIEKLNERMKDAQVDAEIYGRPKHIYSIYRKMHDKKKRFDEIYDLIAIRCLTNSTSDVYTTLGYIHDLWKPILWAFQGLYC